MYNKYNINVKFNGLNTKNAVFFFSKQETLWQGTVDELLVTECDSLFLLNNTVTNTL